MRLVGYVIVLDKLLCSVAFSCARLLAGRTNSRCFCYHKDAFRRAPGEDSASPTSLAIDLAVERQLTARPSSSQAILLERSMDVNDHMFHGHLWWCQLARGLRPTQQAGCHLTDFRSWVGWVAWSLGLGS